MDGIDFLVMAAAMVVWTLLSVAIVLLPQALGLALRLWWAVRLIYYRRRPHDPTNEAGA